MPEKKADKEFSTSFQKALGELNNCQENTQDAKYFLLDLEADIKANKSYLRSLDRPSSDFIERVVREGLDQWLTPCSVYYGYHAMQLILKHNKESQQKQEEALALSRLLSRSSIMESLSERELRQLLSDLAKEVKEGKLISYSWTLLRAIQQVSHLERDSEFDEKIRSQLRSYREKLEADLEKSLEPIRDAIRSKRGVSVKVDELRSVIEKLKEGEMPHLELARETFDRKYRNLNPVLAALRKGDIQYLDRLNRKRTAEEAKSLFSFSQLMGKIKKYKESLERLPKPNIPEEELQVWEAIRKKNVLWLGAWMIFLDRFGEKSLGIISSWGSKSRDEGMLRRGFRDYWDRYSTEDKISWTGETMSLLDYFELLG